MATSSEPDHTIQNFSEQAFFNCANKIESLKCLQCANFETHSLTHLNHHFQAGHTPLDLKETRYDCENCNFRTHSKYLFSIHELNSCTKDETRESDQNLQFGKDETSPCDQSESDFRCNDCSYRTPIKSALDDHLKLMHRSSGNKWYKCEYCRYETTVMELLKCHIVARHIRDDKIQWFECAQCPFRTKYKFVLTKHTKTKHCEESKYLCNQCPYRTRYVNSLRDHIAVKHTEPDKVPLLQCPKCPYTTNKISTFRNHKKSKHHKFKCRHCTFETRSKDSLKCHVLVKHTESENAPWFQCGECPYKSKAKPYLNIHMRTAHGRRNIKCDFCTFQTRFKTAMEYHVLSVHPEPDKVPWFRCTHCSYKSTTNEDLQKHVEEHTLRERNPNV